MLRSTAASAAPPGYCGVRRPLGSASVICGVRPLVNLICEECGRQADVVAHAWRTVLTNEDDGSTQTATYCPECARREFGDEENKPPDEL